MSETSKPEVPGSKGSWVPWDQGVTLVSCTVWASGSEGQNGTQAAWTGTASPVAQSPLPLHLPACDPPDLNLPHAALRVASTQAFFNYCGPPTIPAQQELPSRHPELSLEVPSTLLPQTGRERVGYFMTMTIHLPAHLSMARTWHIPGAQLKDADGAKERKTRLLLQGAHGPPRDAWAAWGSRRAALTEAA